MNPSTHGVVTVTDSGNGQYAQQVTVGRHLLSADEPESVGGNDACPSPYEFLLAGLGACTVITMRMYAQRHNWNLRHASVELQHEKIPSADGKSLIDQFQRVISLEGELMEEQRLRLFQIAEKCPVSETLRRSSVVESSLEDTLTRTT